MIIGSTRRNSNQYVWILIFPTCLSLACHISSLNVPRHSRPYWLPSCHVQDTTQAPLQVPSWPALQPTCPLGSPHLPRPAFPIHLALLCWKSRLSRLGKLLTHFPSPSSCCIALSWFAWLPERPRSLLAPVPHSVCRHRIRAQVTCDLALGSHGHGWLWLASASIVFLLPRMSSFAFWNERGQPWKCWERRNWQLILCKNGQIPNTRPLMFLHSSQCVKWEDRVLSVRKVS